MRGRIPYSRTLKSITLLAILLLLPVFGRAEDDILMAQQHGAPGVPPRVQVVTRPIARPGKYYYIEPYVGGGAASEYGTTAYGKVGVKARYYLTREMNLGFGVSDAVYSQMYVNVVPSQASTVTVPPYTYARPVDLVPIWVTEQKIDAEVHVRYRIPIGRSPVSLYPLGGLKGIFLQNGVFNSSLGGIHAGLELGYAMGGKTSLEAGGDYLYDLIGVMSPQTTTSLFGAPWSVASYKAALGYRLNPQYRLMVGYDGQAIFFQSVSRLYNGLNVSLIF